MIIIIIQQYNNDNNNNYTFIGLSNCTELLYFEVNKPITDTLK